MARMTVIRRLLLALLLFASASVEAHFNLDLNIRTIHVVHTSQGLDVYMRLPTPIFLAGLAGKADEVPIPKPAPFTYNRVESGILLHYLDLDAIREAPLEFASLAEAGQEFSVDGKVLGAEIVDVGLHHALEQPPFSSLEEARRAFEGELFPYDYPEIHVGASVTDLLLRYRHDTPIDTYTYRSTFNPGLEGQENTANLVLDYFPGNVRVHRLTGLLNKPVQIRNSDWAAVSTFVRQGVVHILIGLDHVLFVLCLTAGAAGLVGLLWRVTGFTLGHTVTLILGFLGFVPSGEWFIPAVETAIALTIIYAAVIILLSGRRASDSVVSYAVTTGIGLVHGLGFSFVLHELLLPGGAHLWKSLISFNVGVEIGQVLIVAAVWAVLLGVARISRTALVAVHWAVALPCIALASFWTLERGLMLAEILFPPWAS
ncbi:MAG: HupE/UreJ family protein [Gammaproteobacteria bacterium]|nr:HupE/UreJ family protein [Gammaproteobacteria bacterium]